MGILKQKLLQLARKHRLFAHFLVEIKYLRCLFNKRMTKLDMFILDHAAYDEEQDKKHIKKLKKDLIYCELVYEIRPYEYFLFGFPKLNSRGRSEFVGQNELNRVYNNISDEKTAHMFRNKSEAYDKFRQFYGRELIKVEKPEDIEKFLDFTKKHNRFMVKMIDGHAGKGAYIANLTEDARDKQEIFNEILNYKGAVIEELIEQVIEMSEFHPQSVNTIRFTTYFSENKLTKVQTVLRMGCGNNYVDNAGAGGVYALIDLETGIIKDAAHNEQGQTFLFHPDTGKQIIGVNIPKWKELNNLVEILVRVVPEQKIVGWDFALTPKGWVMVEGNTLPVLQVFDSKNGYRDFVENITEK